MRRTLAVLGMLLWLALAPATAATGLDAADALSWGMSPQAARAALPDAVSLPEPWEFGPFTAPLMVPEVRVGGTPFRLFLQFDAERKLRQVLFENRRGVRSKRVIRALLDALDRRYGPPTWSCGGGDADAKRVTLVWPGPTNAKQGTTVQATFLDFLTSGVLMRDPSQDIDPLRTWREQEILNWRFLPRRLLIRLHSATDPRLKPDTGDCRRLSGPAR